MDMGAYTHQDVAARTEIAMLLARMANKHSVEFGSTNDLLLGAKQKVLLGPGMFTTLSKLMNIQPNYRQN